MFDKCIPTIVFHSNEHLGFILNSYTTKIFHLIILFVLTILLIKNKSVKYNIKFNATYSTYIVYLIINSDVNRNFKGISNQFISKHHIIKR